MEEKNTAEIEELSEPRISVACDPRYHSIDWFEEETKPLKTHTVHNHHARSKLQLLSELFSSIQPFILAALSGTLTAVVTAATDIIVELLADLKEGRCRNQWWRSSNRCNPDDWKPWGNSILVAYPAYVLLALGLAFFSVIITLQSKRPLYPPARLSHSQQPAQVIQEYKYMAAGSGIAEIKSVLSGFELPHLLDETVIISKLFGMVFAISSGLCLGKEAPMIHIATGIGQLVTRLFPSCVNNGVKLRETLTVASAAGLSAAFGTPFGGILFCYEEVSTFFPRPVMLRAVVCSLVAAAVLKALNPFGTGALVQYRMKVANHTVNDYVAFVILGIVGGIFGAVVCRLYRSWSLFKKKHAVLSRYPIIEVLFATALTGLIQYPNPLIRSPGIPTFRNLLITCSKTQIESLVCTAEAGYSPQETRKYLIFLGSGVISKLFLTIITFGLKIPTGILIPALDAGALFGRLMANLAPYAAPNVYAAVAASAFLAATSRMVLSLAVIMVELTGASELVLAYLVAILTAKTVADTLCPDGIYEIGLQLNGHPFLDPNAANIMMAESADTVTAADVLDPLDETFERTVHCDEMGIITKTRLIEALHSVSSTSVAHDLVVLGAKGELIGIIPFQKLTLVSKIVQEGTTVDRSPYGANPDRNTFIYNSNKGVDPGNLIEQPTLLIESSISFSSVIRIFVRLGPNRITLVEGRSRRFVGIITKGRMVQYIDSFRKRIH